jgi:hypothetical protein
MAELRARHGGDLARDAEDGEPVAAVRRHLDGDHRVGHTGDVRERCARRLLGQLEHAARVLAEAELRLRAEHPGGGDAAELDGGHLAPVRQPRPRQRHGDDLVGGEARRARHDLDRRALPGLDAADGALGVGCGTRQPKRTWRSGADLSMLSISRPAISSGARRAPRRHRRSQLLEYARGRASFRTETGQEAEVVVVEEPQSSRP